MQKNIGWVNFYSNVFFLSWVLSFEHSPIKLSKPGATFFLPSSGQNPPHLMEETGTLEISLFLCPPRGAGSIPTLRQLQPAAEQSCANGDQATNICCSWALWPFPPGEGCSTSPLWKATRSPEWKHTEEFRAPQQPCSKCLLFKAQSC